MRASQSTFVVVALVLSTARLAGAEEICGNGIDDDSDGYADEACGFSNAVMGVCPSPVSCGATGDIAPVTGAWVYQLPADISPKVPFGPALVLRRTYLSMYSPPATNYRTAMGPRWSHNWQSWLDKSGTTVIVHLPTGQDVRFDYANTTGGYDHYAPQAGYDVSYLRQATTSPNHWELRTLTGETYQYDWSSPVGKLIGVRDTMANTVAVAYFTSGGNKDQIDTITDAAGKKRLKFSYNQGRVSSVAYQTISGSATTRVTVTYSYTSTNLTTVQTGGVTSQTNTYASGYLTKIADGGGKSIVEASYASGTSGRVVNVTTGQGGIGYDYGSGHTQCTGGTVLFFNLANATSCSIDADCGTGLRCGGKTGSGSTGKCYRAAQCLQTVSPSEDLVTTMTALTPCSGACAPVTQYSWNTSTLDLKGRKLADNNWTSYMRNSDGMITLMAEGDTDDDPTNTGGIKTWMFYGVSNFPGRLSESRRRSDLHPEAPCDASNTSGCKRTEYGWNTTTGLLDSRTDSGWTYNASNVQITFAYTTAYTYDSVGRITQVDGPLSGSNDVTQYTYWTSSDVLKDGYLNELKRKKDSSLFLTTVFDEYDYFGNAKSTQDPDGTFTCQNWDANRNHVIERREAMNGQTSCVTSDPSDLTTTFLRDTWSRLTKTTRPKGDCQHLDYDSFGRLATTKPRDDCTPANAGDTRTETYTVNGLVEQTEYLDANANVTWRAKQTFHDGTQLAGVENPVSPSYARSLSYLSDAQADTIVAENNLGKTAWFWDTQNRATKQRRYVDGSTFQDWTFDYPNTNATTSRVIEKVTDPASKVTETKHDDLGRRVRVVSPDSGTTLYVYDAASRLVTQVEAYGLSGQLTHAFAYDERGRRLSEDYDDANENCSDGQFNVVEVQYSYDGLPNGVSCPAGASCSRLPGRLAYVKNKLLCDPSYSDKTLDQETFYAYDDAGRVVQEYIRDDTSRTAIQAYAWDKNGNLVEVTAPSGAAMTYTMDGTGNSNANLVTAIARKVAGTPTTMISAIEWMPFGPVKRYDQANAISGNNLKATLTWNLAYRASQIKYATTSVDKTTINYTEDAKGRCTQKLYTNVHANVQNSYLAYDWFDRPTCDAAASGTCPTSGTNLRTNVRQTSGATGYNTSNDRAAFYHQDPAYGDFHNAVSFVSGKDQISSIAQSGGGTTATISYGWDSRGNRISDDNNNSSVDRRDYTYEGRRRVRTVTRKVINLFGTIQDVRITYAYDHRDRMVFWSYKNLSTGFEGHRFYYYDLQSRLIEFKAIQNISTPSSYTIYSFYWLGERPVVMWGTWSSGSTARYFMHADGHNRILEIFDWPDSGDANLQWAINPDAFGWDRIAVGSPYFQPLRLSNSIVDEETRAPTSSSSWNRPALLINRGTHYDPMTGTVLQPFGRFPDESYSLGSNNPDGEAGEAGEPGNIGLPDSTVHYALDNPCPDVVPGESTTFSGDNYFEGNGCFGTANFNEEVCGQCVFLCSLQSGCEPSSPFRLCYEQGVCTESTLLFMNECKASNCGADTSRPQSNAFLLGTPCEVTCGFNPKQRHPYAVWLDRNDFPGTIAPSTQTP